MKGFTTVMLAVFSMAVAEPEFYTFEIRYGQSDLSAKESIEVDEAEQYLMAEITPVEGNLAATENLHDFAAGYTAIRDDASGICYIFEVSHSLQEMLDEYKDSVQKKGFFEVTQKFTCTNKKFVPQTERYRFGARIAKLCEDHELVYSEKRFSGRQRRSTQMMVGNALICGICAGWC